MALRSKKAKKWPIFSLSETVVAVVWCVRLSPKILLLFDTPPLLSGFLLVRQAN